MLGLALLVVALPAAAEQAWVRGEVRLNLRSGAGNQYRILGVIKTGDAVQVLERGENWTKIRTGEGEEGWIPGGYLDAQPPPTIRLGQLESEVERLSTALEKSEVQTTRLRQRSDELTTTDAEQKAEIERLTTENYRLHAGERWAEWITGALILSTGMALGALLSRISGRRHRQRLRL